MRTGKCYSAALLLAIAMSLCTAAAQVNTFCQAHAETLYCKIPSLFGTPVVNPLQPLDQALATQLTLVPLASPASGIVYTQSPGNKLPVASGTETFGLVLTERGETLYVKKLFVAGVYQRFRFDSLDGVNLKQIPMLFFFCDPNGQCGPIATIVSRGADLVDSEKGSGSRLEEEADECRCGREIPGQTPRAGRGRDLIRPLPNAIASVRARTRMGPGPWCRGG